MLKWVRVKDLYFLYLSPSSARHRGLAKLTCYYLAKFPGATIEDLFAVVGEGASLELDEKNAVRAYLKKLKAYGLAAEAEGKWYPKFPIIPARVVRELVELHAEDFKAKYSPRAVEAWRRGERLPDLQRLMTALI